METPHLSVIEIADAVAAAAIRPSRRQIELLRRIAEQRERLADSIFHLAVLGQFKRGKSTLLNAIVGYPLLTAGVLPLTAVPTFLTGGSATRIRLTYLSGKIEEIEPTDLQGASTELAAATTELGNPKNVRMLRRVDVRTPSSPWLNRLILVDTPGIGSTHDHNTRTAQAALLECDAALFVSSADPPITQLEIEYLDEICRSLSSVVIVLNKIDLLDREDLERTAEFFSSTIANLEEPLIERRIFPVSARRALAAREQGDDEALKASGLPELEEYVRSRLVNRKRDLLETSVAKKMLEILNVLRCDTAMAVRSLIVPLADFDRMIILFEELAREFRFERDKLLDFLTGERRRSLGRLEALCDEEEKCVRIKIESMLTGVVSAERLADVRSRLERTMSEACDAAFSGIIERVELELTKTIDVQMQIYRELSQRVQEAAGAIMSVNLPSVTSEDWFQVKREPYWVGQALRENLSESALEGFASFLPSSIRRRRAEKILREAAQRAVTRNISSLQWTMGQNIEDSFRRLSATAIEAVDMTIDRIHELLTKAREMRRLEGGALGQEIDEMRNSERALEQLDNKLREHVVRLANLNAS